MRDETPTVRIAILRLRSAVNQLGAWLFGSLGLKGFAKTCADTAVEAETDIAEDLELIYGPPDA